MTYQVIEQKQGVEEVKQEETKIMRGTEEKNRGIGRR